MASVGAAAPCVKVDATMWPIAIGTVMVPRLIPEACTAGCPEREPRDTRSFPRQALAGRAPARWDPDARGEMRVVLTHLLDVAGERGGRQRERRGERGGGQARARLLLLQPLGAAAPRYGARAAGRTRARGAAQRAGGREQHGGRAPQRARAAAQWRRRQPRWQPRGIDWPMSRSHLRKRLPARFRSLRPWGPSWRTVHA